MSNEMIERVAESLWDAGFSDNDKYANLSLHNRYIAQDMAKAAIEAYESHLKENGLVVVPREPTESMLKAVHEVQAEGYMSRTSAHKAMISAALSAAPKQDP